MRGILQSIFLISLTFMFACKSLKEVRMPSVATLPAQFADKDDSSSSIGFLPRKEFFSDTILLHLIDTALNNNLDMQLALQRIETSSAAFQIAKGNFLPQLAGSASSGLDRYGYYTMNGVGNFDTNLSDRITESQKAPNPTPDFFAGLRSSWEIGLWGKNRNLKKAAFARYLASKNARLLVTTNLVSKIAENYYQLLALDNELEIIRKNILLQTKALEIMDIMKDGGRANELGVRQVNAQLLNTKSLEFEKIQQIRYTENILNQLTGRFPQEITRGKPLLEQELPNTTHTGIPSAMLLRRPDIQEAEMQLMASKADVRYARAAFFPSLNISAYGGFNAFKSSLLFTYPASLAYGIFSGIYAPILQRNVLKSNYRRTVADQKSAFISYQKVVIESYQEVMTSLQGIKNYQEVYFTKAQEVENLHNAVNASNDLFVSGYASYLEVITAQKSVLAAEIELAEAKKSQFLFMIDLYHALGGGWE